jgi:hypothetical protein
VGGEYEGFVDFSDHRVVRACTPALAQQRDFQPPTATEVLNLQTKCAQLAERMVESFAHGPDVTMSQMSHYNPRAKRCYVQITTQTIGPNKSTGVDLYDGQTEDLLAFIKIDKGGKAGVVFDWRHTPKSLTNAGWDDTKDYMDQIMAEDRK